MVIWWQEEKPQSQRLYWSFLSVSHEINSKLPQQAGKDETQKEEAS